MPMPGTHRWPLPADSTAPGAARDAVASALAGWSGADDACLVVSELATNAVQHGHAPIELTVVCETDGVELTVTNARSPGASTPRLADPMEAATSGHGLRIVQALCQSWDWHASEDRMTVRARLST